MKELTNLGQPKKTYYITLANGEISQLKSASPWNFKIEATDDEIDQLREYFDQNYSTDWQAFYRAHIPYIEYHHDPQNDAYDETLKNIYKMIYDLGDEETRNHISSEGILKGLE